MGKRGESFARWYYAQGMGRQYVVCLGPVAMMVFGLMLIFPMPEVQPEGTVKVECSRTIYFSEDDPRLKSMGLASFVEALCTNELAP